MAAAEAIKHGGEWQRTELDTINAQGGVVTLNTPCAADGTIPIAVLKWLQQLASVKDKLKDGQPSF